MNIPINPQMQEWSKIDLGALAQRTRADSKKIQEFIEAVRTPKKELGGSRDRPDGAASK